MACSPAHSSSPSSRDTSYVSAREGNSTTASSPVNAHPCPYRDARELPRELKQHCQIFLEEQLYICAIQLLNSLLGAGASRRKPDAARSLAAAPSKPVNIPPASHLSLIVTLAIHPLHTTRVDKAEQLDVPSQALGYLRSLLAVVGPIKADFRTALQFHHATRWARRSGYHSHGNNSDASDGESDPEGGRLAGRLSNEDSLWNRGQDFWSVLGWAMNCSVGHPHRWRYWKLWLEFMIEVMDCDWQERERMDLEAEEAGADAPVTTARQGSIIQMYMDQQAGRRGSFKMMAKALLADGGDISKSAFREIFDKEPRGPRKDSKKRKRGDDVLDLENDKFGDYLDDDSISSGASEPPTPQRPRDPRRGESLGVSHPGLAESINLRLHVFRLISAATVTLGRRGDIEQLYEDFSTGVKLLPLPVFSLVVSQQNTPLPAAAHVSLLNDLFHRLLPASFKDPRKVDRDGAAAGQLSMPILEHCFVPHAANTVAVDDNAKLSLIVESGVQLMWQNGMVSYTESFARAVEKGIAARDAKTEKRRTGKARTVDPTDILAQDMLRDSAERLHLLLEAMEMTS